MLLTCRESDARKTGSKHRSSLFEQGVGTGYVGFKNKDKTGRNRSSMRQSAQNKATLNLEEAAICIMVELTAAAAISSAAKHAPATACCAGLLIRPGKLGQMVLEISAKLRSGQFAPNRAIKNHMEPQLNELDPFWL